MELYADIILPLAQGTYSYRIDGSIACDIAPGRCVEAELAGKLYVGIVWRTYPERPPFKTIKTIARFVASAPVITPLQMRFWEWMAGYYMCNLGDVMRCAIPSALKPKGFSHEEFEQRTYRPPTVQYISLHPSLATEDTLNDTLEKLARRAPKQYAAVMAFCDAAGTENLSGAELRRTALQVDGTILRQLEKKNIFVTTTRELKQGELPPLPSLLPRLTAVQQQAADSITEHFASKDVALLHGVTGSGKTEIYINLIARELAAGRNVLYLLPEIAMTAQLIQRIEGYFGERVITYHSTFPERRRVEAYRRANRSRGGELIIGVRSSVFLPAGDLGLVIVDEEHDQSYKNMDFAPRYHARDSAVVLARMSGAKTLLGSATPSLESYTNASSGKYGLTTLAERYGDSVMPRIIISDTIRSVKRGERKTHFNKELLDNIAETLESGRQAILFQNRRGFSPYVECGECGWIAMCPNCNVALTLHKADGRLRCHYCSHNSPAVHICPGCNRPAVQPQGFGTEKIEDELSKLFPAARIERLDRDTSRTVSSYNAIISSFEQGRTDILVGTQMITKGFDFGGVALVGILNADNLLAYPDFRASERAFQLMTQVAGRAGRRTEQGTVVIQTAQPAHPVIRQVATCDYDGMARTQLAERNTFFYPPYCRLICITMRHRDKNLLWKAAGTFTDGARTVFGRRLSGPMPPPVDRIKGEYLLSILLKIERDQPFAKAKELLVKMVVALHRQKEYRYISVTFNVDPQ